MFRRVAAAVPAQAGRVLATAARPSIASPLRTAAPTVAAAGRRQYHEKDKSFLCAPAMTSRKPALLGDTSEPLLLSTIAITIPERQANTPSTARPLQPPAQCRLHVQDRHGRWHRPRGRAGLRRRHEAADPRGPQQQHHQRRQVQDVRVRQRDCEFLVPDRVGAGNDA
jgi:hypothetical protein